MFYMQGWKRYCLSHAAILRLFSFFLVCFSRLEICKGSDNLVWCELLSSQIIVTLSSESGYLNVSFMSSYAVLQKYARVCVYFKQIGQNNRKLLSTYLLTSMKSTLCRAFCLLRWNIAASHFRSISVTLPRPVSGTFARSSRHNCSASFKLDGLMCKSDHRPDCHWVTPATVKCVSLNRPSLAVVLAVHLWSLSCCWWEVIVQP